MDSDYKAKLKLIFEKAFEQSNIVGLSNIVTNKHIPMKVVWIVSVLASFAICAYMIAESVIIYLQYDVISKMSVVYETTSPFPTISVCNSVPFVTDASTVFVENVMATNNFGFFLNYTDVNVPLEPYKYLSQYLNAVNAYNLSTAAKKTMGLTLDEMLLSCMYSGGACSSSDFDWYYDVLYGNCYRFNSGKNNSALKNTTNTGKWNGLRLELYVGSTNDIEMNQPSTGVHLFIHNNTNTLDSMKGFDAATSTESNIAVSRKFSSRLSEP